MNNPIELHLARVGCAPCSIDSVAFYQARFGRNGSLPSSGSKLVILALRIPFKIKIPVEQSPLAANVEISDSLSQTNVKRHHQINLASSPIRASLGIHKRHLDFSIHENARGGFIAIPFLCLLQI